MYGDSMNYEFKEDEVIKKLKKYIDSTYQKHYGSGKFQATEVVFDSGYGEGFCLGNIMKYAQRYGKKGKKKELDLYKLIHYAVILIGKLEKERKWQEQVDEWYGLK